MSFSLPNFYFHATTAYDILRTNGVPLGKRDFMGRLKMKKLSASASEGDEASRDVGLRTVLPFRSSAGSAGVVPAGEGRFGPPKRFFSLQLSRLIACDILPHP